ncbi:MAG: hypothetical protein Ct9H300mP1_07510 [Planctomycetaceae bacterium]|nr:MAG: hypothetical protein Ct9H300mP1_07510 [Planctomycetaceae bacterium]
MLRILGTGRSLSPPGRGGLDRREMLRVGGLGLAGSLTGGSILPGPRNPFQARVRIDLRPCQELHPALHLRRLGASSTRSTRNLTLRKRSPGEFGTIASKLSGVRVNELLPMTAKVLDRCTVIRSMSHPWPLHNAAYTLTGNLETTNLEGRQRHPDHWPFFGGVLDFLDERTNRENRAFRPPVSVGLPWVQSTRSGPNKRAGTFGGFLGASYDPVWGEFRGEMPQGDPYLEVTPEGRFSFSERHVPGLTLDILNRRRSLLGQLEDQARWIDQASSVRSYQRTRERAFSVASSDKLRRGLDIQSEPAGVRERYGMNLFGQSCLSARRLIENDVKLVTVIWDEWERSDESWDTHHDHHPRMRKLLLPGFDRAYSALIRDLEQRGMLDDTLVLCLSEHGRTPKFYDTSKGPGRGHWSEVYSQLFAGAGIRPGT